MKIVIYANSFFPDIGGGEKYNFDLANSLNELGDEVTVITPVESKTKDNFKFRVIRIPGSKVLSAWKLLKILKKLSPDILHISGPTEIDFILPTLSKFLNIYVILTYHADFPSKLGRFYNSMLGLFQFPIDAIIVQTHSDKEKLTKRLVSEKHIIEFPFNGVDTSIYRKFNDEKNRNVDLVFVGRMDKAHSYKGHWNFLKILDMLSHDCGSNAQVYIVGGGEEFDLFKENCSEIGIEIRFMKDARDEELIELLNRTKYLILPSTSNSEGFGRTVLEAIYCGAIPIVSKFAGSHEVVYEQSCGYVINPLEIEETSILICKLIRDYHEDSHELSAIRSIIANEEFSLQWTVSKTRGIYFETLKEKFNRQRKS